MFTNVCFTRPGHRAMMYRSHNTLHCEDEDSSTSSSNGEARKILNCLASNRYYGLLPPNEYKSINNRSNNYVSITINGTENNTRLTMSNSNTNLRRSRSGLPLLGTASVNRNGIYTTSPSKPVRNKISTTSHFKAHINSSPNSCDCGQRVTVNGQHHCSYPYDEGSDYSQPNSIINI